MQDAPVEEVVLERVAAIDVGKAEVVCYVRMPSAGRRNGEPRKSVGNPR